MFKKRQTFIFIFTIIFEFVSAQNFLLNPGFEPLSKDSFSWSNPTNTTPDYHSLTKPGWWVTYEPQLPHSGFGFFHLAFSPNNLEYIQTKLAYKLLKNKKYCISLYASLMHKNTGSFFAIDKLGVALTRNKIGGKVEDLYNNVDGLVYLTNGDYIIDTESWIKICSMYQAQGGEKYLTIGPFGDLPFFEILNEEEIKGDKNTHVSYFIDDLSLVEIGENDSCTCSKENKIIKPILIEMSQPINKQDFVEIEEKIRIENVYFELNQANLLNSSYSELNKWVEYFNKNPKLKIKIEGHTDNTGDTSYNLKLSELRAKSIYDYFISKNISKDRLSYLGYGESYIIDKNRIEKNRRVEFIIIDK